MCTERRLKKSYGAIIDIDIDKCTMAQVYVPTENLCSHTHSYRFCFRRLEQVLKVRPLNFWGYRAKDYFTHEAEFLYQCCVKDCRIHQFRARVTVANAHRDM